MSEKNKWYDNHTPEEMAAVFQESIRGSFSDVLGLKVLKHDRGYCLTKTGIAPELMNPMESVHGGCLYTIADTTASIASIELGKGRTVVTIDGDMQFLKAAMGMKNLYGEAKVLKEGKRIVHTEVIIKGDDETIYAKGRFIFSRIMVAGTALSRKLK